MEYLEEFLLKNGFTVLEKDRSYANEFCNVVIEDDCYAVANNEGNTMYSVDLNIYWLIGILTYYGYLNKNYKQ